MGKKTSQREQATKGYKVHDPETLSALSKALYDASGKEEKPEDQTSMADLQIVIMCTSFIEHSLATLIKTILVETSENSLLDPIKPLGPLEARAVAAYSLGLISDGLRDEIKKIGVIRNRFAHNFLNITFEDNMISQLCDNLKCPAFPLPSIGQVNARSRFRMSAIFIVNHLILTAMAIAASTKRQGKEDPEKRRPLPKQPKPANDFWSSAANSPSQAMATDE